MKRIALCLLVISALDTAGAASLELVSDVIRNSNGTLIYQIFKTCPSLTGNGCIYPDNSWIIANAVMGSTATWDWNTATQTLTATGILQSTSFYGSNPAAVALTSDKTVDLTINTGASTTTATSYQCIEGNFFIGAVGVNGCLNTSTGSDFRNDSSALYNVGGNANCVQRTVGGDDSSLGNPYGLIPADAAGACDAVVGIYNLWTVVLDTTGIGTGGQLILSNGIPFGNCSNPGCVDGTAAGAHHMTFNVVPIPPAVWLLGTALTGLGGRQWLRRRKATP